MESVIKLLLEELHDLTVGDLKDIRNILSCFPSNSPYLSISFRLLGMKANRQDTILLLVQTYSQHAVDQIEKLFNEMNRPDLVFSLTESEMIKKSTIKTSYQTFLYSTFTHILFFLLLFSEKHFYKKRSSALIQKVSNK